MSRDRMQQEEPHIEPWMVELAKRQVAMERLIIDLLALTSLGRVEAKLREGQVVNADWFVERSILAERARELGITEEETSNGTEDDSDQRR